MSFSVLHPIFAKKLLTVSAISIGLSIILLSTLSWSMEVPFGFFILIIDLMPSHIFLLLVLYSLYF